MGPGARKRGDETRRPEKRKGKGRGEEEEEEADDDDEGNWKDDIVGRRRGTGG